MTGWLRRAAPLTAPVVVAGMLTACGSSATTPTSTTVVPSAARTRIQASVSATDRAGTALFTSVSTTEAGSGAYPTVVTMTGAIDFRGPDVSSATTIRSSGTGSATPEQVHGLYFGATGTVYLSTAGSDGPWQRSTSKVPFGYLAPLTPRGLSDTPGPVTVLGAAVIDGVATTGYSVPVPGQSQSTSETGASTTSHTAPSIGRVWLDSDGRIVRTAGTFRVTVEPGGSSYTETETTTLSAFGTPVAITRPANSTQG